MRHPLSFQVQIRLEWDFRLPVVFFWSTDTTGMRFCFSSRIFSERRYDWNAILLLQSYFHGTQIRLEWDFASPVVFFTRRDTTGMGFCFSSRIFHAVRYDWNGVFVSQSYFSRGAIRLEWHIRLPVVFFTRRGTTGTGFPSLSRILPFLRSNVACPYARISAMS